MSSQFEYTPRAVLLLLWCVYIRQYNSSLSESNKTNHPTKLFANMNFPCDNKSREKTQLKNSIIIAFLSVMLVRMSNEYWSIVGEISELFNHISTPDNRTVSH